MAKFTFDTTKLKEQVEDNPVVFLGALGIVLSGAAKLMNANTQRKNSKTWNREVARREKLSK